MRCAVITLLVGCGRIGFAPTPDAPPVANPCDATDPDLVGCWAFEHDTVDGSRYHNDVTATQIDFAPGIDGTAVVTSDASQLLIAESPTLDVDSVTIEMWVNLAAYPSSFALLYDCDDQYALGVTNTGAVRGIAVSGGTATADTTSVLPLGAWHHVAMRYDATTTVDVLFDDVVEHSSPAIGPLSTGGTTGSRIAGDAGTNQTPPVIGMFDDVEVWRVPKQF